MSNKTGFAGPVTVAAASLLVLLPLFYTLSAGPVIGLMARGYVSERATTAVYYPLAFVCENCTPVGEGINWYVDLFLPADEFEIPLDGTYMDPSAIQPAWATTRQPPPVY